MASFGKVKIETPYGAVDVMEGSSSEIKKKLKELKAYVEDGDINWNRWLVYLSIIC